jgi:hypothetical protein
MEDVRFSLILVFLASQNGSSGRQDGKSKPAASPRGTRRIRSPKQARIVPDKVTQIVLPQFFAIMVYGQKTVQRDLSATQIYTSVLRTQRTGGPLKEKSDQDYGAWGEYYRNNIV